MTASKPLERINGLAQYLKSLYGGRVVKLALDGGFTCPNRDGTLGYGGCIFCGERGGGDFAGEKGASIADQLRAQMALTRHKWPDARYIAYFQNFSGTYKPTSALNQLYGAASSAPNVEGLAVATRPDCIEPVHIEVFKRHRVLWVELGLQTCHADSAEWMHRGYDLKRFERAYALLRSAEIPVVIHLIAGLPVESKADFLETVQYVSALKPFGVKFHMLNILTGTKLGRIYAQSPFEMLSREAYIDWVCDALEWIDPQTVIHRLTGDANKEALLSPGWACDKRAVLGGIYKEMKRRGSYQGSRLE